MSLDRCKSFYLVKNHSVFGIPTSDIKCMYKMYLKVVHLLVVQSMHSCFPVPRCPSHCILLSHPRYFQRVQPFVGII